jgi:hypothetical protein
LNWEFSRCSGVALIRGFNDLYYDVLSKSYFTGDYFCHGAPQSRSDQDGTLLTRKTDKEEKL